MNKNNKVKLEIQKILGIQHQTKGKDISKTT